MIQRMSFLPFEYRDVNNQIKTANFALSKFANAIESVGQVMTSRPRKKSR